MSTVISGNIKSLVAGAITSRTLVRFTLKGMGGNQPRVNGAALIAPSGGGVEWYADAIPDKVTGAISITLYSTRDAAGTGNGEIECGGSFLSCFYEMMIIHDGGKSPRLSFHAKNGVATDITSITPINAIQPVSAPSGDTTYARLDGGNQPFTGKVIVPVGSAAAPSLTFNTDTTTGFFRQAASVIGAVIAGVCSALFNGTGIKLGSGGIYKWSFNADPSVANADTGLSRTFPGVVAVGNGAQGDASGFLQIAAVGQGSPTVAFSILDNNSVAHFFIAGTAPFTNTFIQGNGAGSTFIGTGSFAVNIPDNSNVIIFSGATSGTTQLKASAIASGVLTLPAATATLATLVNTLGDFAATTSAQLKATISDETGSGALVFGTAPTIGTPVISGGSIDNATVGNTTAAAGKFTTLKVTSGAGGSGSAGLQHGRVTTGSIASAARTAVTLTWAQAFADTNYTVTVSVFEGTAAPGLSLRIEHIVTVNAGSIVVSIVNDNAGALTGVLEGIAIHD